MAVPSFEEDFYGDAFILDPLPRYQQMRSMGPVVWLPAQNAYAVVQHREVIDALRKPQLFQSGKGLSLNDDVNELLIGSTLNTDGDRHKRQRAVTATAIMPPQLKELEPFIASAATSVTKTLCEKGEFDAVRDFAQILPLTIVTELIGLPAHGKAKMLEWAAATFNLFEGFNERSKGSMGELVDLRNFLDEYGSPEQLAAGGLSRRIFDEAPKAGFSIEESVQLMRDYINPSLDTTISATGFLAYHCAKDPAQWDLIRADHSLISNAIEEIVRLSTPIRAFSRYVAEDVAFGGADMKQGDRVIIVHASANRDEKVFPNPDKFDVTRKTHKHVGFGHGKHMCMGLHLARLEMHALILEMAKSARRWHFAGDAEIAMNNTIRGFASLPMRIEVA